MAEITYEIYRTVERKWGTELYVKNVTVDGEKRPDLDQWIFQKVMPISETRLDKRIKEVIEKKIFSLEHPDPVPEKIYAEQEVMEILRQKAFVVGDEKQSLDDIPDAISVMNEFMRLKQVETQYIALTSEVER